MRNLISSAAATAMCAMIAVSVAPTQASAGVVGVGDQAKIRTASPVEQVYYRYYGHRHYYHHYRHYGYWRPHYYRHYGYWRHHYYRHYGYYPYYYNPAAAVVGTAAAVATFPFWGWGYPYY
ncbi:MAG TPA: hypothetical protein VIF61_10575 [Methylocystis sp.]|jgi:hypothetical protein